MNAAAGTPAMARAFRASADFSALEQSVLPLAMGGSAEARLLLAVALSGRDARERCVTLLRALAREQPSGPHPAQQAAMLLHDAGRTDLARRLLTECTAADPADRRLPLASASLAHHAGDLSAAAETLEAALAADREDWPARNLLGIVAAEQGRSEVAEACFRAAFVRSPEDARAQANLGRLLVAQGRCESGLLHLARAVRLAPDDVQIRLNHATALLKAGRFIEGWRAYEWRFRTPGHTDLPLSRLLPTLAPDNALTGQTILVTQEEGFGDFIQFSRYLPMLLARGAQVVVWTPEPLTRLLAPIRGVTWLEGDVDAVAFDWHCPILSLPRVFATTTQTIPPPLDLTPPRPLVDAWAMRLGPAPGMRVGVVWNGAPRPDDPAAAAIDRQRSVRPEVLAPLAELRDVLLVSLQAGATHPGAALPFALTDPMAEVRDFADTAALIANLHAVVSVDTAVAHLAASMGKPVLLLDRYDNCWRWLHGRQDSAWYPSLQLLRQERPGDWSQPVARAAAILRGLAQEVRGIRDAG